MTDRNGGQSTEGRTPDGTFAPGNPGKPPGSRHRATIAIQKLLDDDGEAGSTPALPTAANCAVPPFTLCERFARAASSTESEAAV